MHISFTALIQVLRKNFDNAQIEIHNCISNSNCVWVEIDNGDISNGHGRCVYNFKTMMVSSLCNSWADLLEKVFDQAMDRMERSTEAELSMKAMDDEFYQIMRNNSDIANVGLIKHDPSLWEQKEIDMSDAHLDQMIAMAEAEGMCDRGAISRVSLT